MCPKDAYRSTAYQSQPLVRGCKDEVLSTKDKEGPYDPSGRLGVGLQVAVKARGQGFEESRGRVADNRSQKSDVRSQNAEVPRKGSRNPGFQGSSGGTDDGRSAVPNQPVVFVVKAHPDPDMVFAVRDRDGTERDADPDRPELADRLEVE